MFDFWLYSYIGGLFGSVSFGYFLLRFGLPDIRTLPQQIKLGLSGFAGVLIFLISALISYFLLTPMFLYLIMPLLTFVGIVGIVLKNLFFAPKVIKVAVPVVKINKGMKKNASKESTGFKANQKEVFEKPAIVNSIVASVKKHEKDKLEERQRQGEEVKSKRGAEKVKLEIQPEKHAEGEKKVSVSSESPYARHRRGVVGKENVEEVKSEAEGSNNVSVSSGKHELSRRERYLKRRGMLVEQVKADLTKPKELKGESAPLPIVPDEDVNLEFGEGLDLSDLDSVGSLSDLGSLEDLSDDEGSLGGLGGLDDLNSLSDDDLSNLGGLSVEQEIKKEKGMSCPTCGAKNVKIIYCPYCGKGFCSNCSLKVQRKGDLIIYQCPNCKKEVIVKAEKK